MKKQLITTLIAASLLASVSTPSAMADTQLGDDSYTVGQQEQLVGLGSGAALGAIVGGPIGAVVGAMVGGIVGTAVGQDQHIQAQDEEITEIVARNTELERISHKYNQAQLEIARLEQEKFELMNVQPTDVDLALEMNVHFRTGSAEIEPLFKAQLDELAEVMKQAPEVKWVLEGFADRRGSSERNFSLSESRVEAVQHYLIERGVDHEQFDVAAYGDQSPLKTEQNFEDDFFDRRVTLRSSSASVQTAGHP
ncbi:sortase-associated OmpA-like protein PdsO [Photobacterium ganghwense]|uniref:sortase-associated OmpA-like protein PdsO n=1 Tax=Photobacterium ganghwense TaxID=320778 RepID=UPI0039EE8A44